MKIASIFLLPSILGFLVVAATPYQHSHGHSAEHDSSLLMTNTSLPIAPMKWTGLVFPNGTNVTLYGNVHQVQAQIHEINPNYEKDFPHNGMDQDLHDDELRRRRTTTVSCHDEVDVTTPSPIKTGIKHLTKLGGFCHVGPLMCTNLYCSDDASIRLCNSNRLNSIEPQCNYLATYATSILEACTFVSDGTVEYKGKWPKGEKLVGGSLWDTDLYLIDVISNQEGGKC